MIKISNPSDCCGCTACVSICAKNAIRMIPDREGFLYPTVNDELCINCGLCLKVCPIIKRCDKPREINYKGIYAVRHRDEKELFTSSSGGFFSVLAADVIKKGGVVYGVKYTKDMEVIHSYTNTCEGVKAFKGSKYVQSNLDGIYKQIKQHLQSNKFVLFTGTPCQVEGLNCYLRKPYHNLITIDLICHAVPSPKVFADYVNYINKLSNDRLIDLNMRYKGGRGWGHRFSYLYTFASGRQEVDWDGVKDWGRLYFKNVITRPSCHTCKFCNLDRPGDFTIADYWDDNNQRPLIYSPKGTSLVIVNSIKADEIFKTLREAIDMWPLSQEEAMQPCLESPTPISNQRKKYWDYYNKHGFEKFYIRYFTNSAYQKRQQIILKFKIIIKRILKLN